MAILQRLLPLSLSIAIAAAVALPVAATGAPPPVDFFFDLESKRPGTATDAKLHILYKDPENPDDPESKPPPLTRVVIAAPRRAVFDGNAVTTCDATNEELMLLGEMACPAESVVGGGIGTVFFDPGPPDPVASDVTLFNYGAGIIELLVFPGNTNVVDRARFTRPNRMVLNPAVVPGVTERQFTFTYEGAGDGRGPFLRTPPVCLRRGYWISRLYYTVTTGATYTAQDRVPCARGG